HDEAQLLLNMTLEKMPPKRREIFMLSRFENLSNKEIAERLGLSVRTVESHIYSALQTLKAAFPDRHYAPA
ncbi:MAG: sigma-70 family RNA polymerase sigma factor, partial [Muribaculaceae bacterium]|nr:sigma-70 family RNA polymerase sigma factor [Muribaculaceae bacterium]